MVSHMQVSAHQGKANVFMEGKRMLEGNSKLRAHDFLLAESLARKEQSSFSCWAQLLSQGVRATPQPQPTTSPAQPQPFLVSQLYLTEISIY